MDHRDRILEIVKAEGPLLPAQINKQLRTNVLFASAMLSEMVDAKKVRLTSMKVGGSPLYYCEGQEHKLENFADRLEPKEYKAYDLLRKTGILRDRDYEPEMRVALREIKDFAIPLEVSAGGAKDLFWKYFLVSDEDAEGMIKDYLNSREPPAAEPKKEVRQRPDRIHEQKEVQASLVEPKQQETVQSVPERIEPIAELKTSPEALSKPVQSVRMAPMQDEHLAYHYEPAFSFSTLIDTDEKVSIEKQRPEEVPQVPQFPEDDEFFDLVKSYFDSRSIEILDFEMVRKGSEFGFMISVPSNIGPLEYYCRAKQKAKVIDADLAPAFVYGQLRKVPVIFLTTGDPTVKTRELLDKDFKSIVFRKLDEKVVKHGSESEGSDD